MQLSIYLLIHFGAQLLFFYGEILCLRGPKGVVLELVFLIRILLLFFDEYPSNILDSLS